MKRKNFLLSLLVSLAGAALTSFKQVLRPKKPIKVDANKDRFNQAFSYRDNQFFLKVSGQDTDGDLCIYDTVRSKKGGPRAHVHHAQDEWFFVQKGEFLFQVGPDRFILKEGDSLLGPRGIPHAFAQLSEGEGKLMLVYQPAGSMELFYKEARSLVNPTPEQSEQLFLKHGMTLTGPALEVN